MFPFYRVIMLPDNCRLLLLVDSFIVVAYPVLQSCDVE